MKKIKKLIIFSDGRTSLQNKPCFFVFSKIFLTFVDTYIKRVIINKN